MSYPVAHGGSGAAIALVLFVLLVIILRAGY
ncbi:sporulation protein YjcZ [Cohnella luojiensis]|uniref:Sporulation protein YjcZ n=1 Tax=Cohnella luojiensis TaxID=652876 RepID=A0A4Y8M705_9BACL|nr:sporulation protein YjcZ [Cohnella luojiensis]